MPRPQLGTLMTQLQALFNAIATAKTEQELRERFMDRVGEFFRVQRWGIYLLNETLHPAQMEVYGLPDQFVECYEAVGREVDPVLHYVIERHAPAHEGMVLPPGGWKQCELYQRCCAYYDHEHIMTGPIVRGGRLAGTVNFARIRDRPVFGVQEIIDLSALCLHLSACLAALRTPEPAVHCSLASRLTSRELQIVQIAQLVAKGLTNAEIGAELWITQNSVKQALKRMFRKLEVSARAEMVARLRVDLSSKL